MLKIQKYINFLYLHVREPHELKKYASLRVSSKFSKEENEQLQLQKLNQLLNHAYTHIPYYKKLFQECNLFVDGIIELSSIKQLRALPFLTKSIVRKEGENLYSDDHKLRKSFVESSGGSTGEPLLFLQDKQDNDNNIGNFYLAKSWRDSSPYDSEIVIWGASKDIFGDKKSLFDQFKDFCRNRIVLNSFKMPDSDLHHYIKLLNKHQPRLIIAYTQSIYELALFAQKNKIMIKKQFAIHAAAGTLHEYMRKTLEEVFQCPVYNHYGCRETGAISSECRAHDGQHIMMDHTLVEIIDENGNVLPDGEQGEVVVTTLDNYSMPLIRYKMSDIAIMKPYESCSCGCTYPKLQEVVGRTTDIFKTLNGDTVTPIFFKFLLGVRYNQGYIQSYQVIQESLELIVIKIVKNTEIPQEYLDTLTKKIKIVMGESCHVNYKFVDEIPKTETGKFLHTFSKINR